MRVGQTVGVPRKPSLVRILIIGEDEAPRVFLRELLLEAGYEVTEAPDGDTGVALYRQAPADLVFTDIEMRKKNGLDVIQELNREFPTVKIIAITCSSGRVALTVIANAKVFGAFRVFVRPVRVHLVLEAVRELLQSTTDYDR